MLGNCHSAALVDHCGTIDWLCLPRFDSDAVFASLLGTPEHGQWALAPAADFRSERAYEDDSLVLRTRLITDTGTVELVDFMVASDDGEVHQHLVRMVRCVQGEVPMHMRLTFRFNYGRTVPWVTSIDGGIRAIAGPDQLALRTPQTLQGKDLGTETDFTLREGESTWFLLSHGLSHQTVPPAIDPDEALQRTTAFWHGWARRCTDVGPWTQQVKRSLVVLKGLSYLPTGGIVAAPTASLPEHLGGTRNWDYRYCWLRDSVFTLIALLQAGYRDEASAFRDWVQRAIAGSPDQLQALYGIAGERRLQEWEAHWLPGYEGSAPVRIGNGAVDQFQLDVYGELIGAFHYAREKACRRRPMTTALRPRCWSTSWRCSKTCGARPTKASGKCATNAATSCIPRSWRGWPSIAAAATASPMPAPKNVRIGAASPRRSAPRCWKKACTRMGISYRATARIGWMRRYC